MVEKDVIEEVKETIEKGKEELGKADTVLHFLESMEIDVSEVRKDYDDVKV